MPADRPSDDADASLDEGVYASLDVDADDSLETLAIRLFEHVEATAELPIDRQTSRWLGEAESVAKDAATGDIDDETRRKRIRQVEHLLEEAGETGREDADAHLESAREICDIVLERE